MSLPGLFEDKNWRNIGLAALVVIGLWIWAYIPQPEGFLVTVLDVGQGDAIVLRAPGGETMLIDAGPGSSGGKGLDAGEKIVLPYLRKTGVRTLDAVVVTHAHDDHAGGMASVLRSVKAGMVLDCGVPHTAPNYIKLLELIEEKEIPYHVVRRGDVLKLGEVTITVLNPPTNATGDLNTRSIVLRAQYGETSVLLAADAGQEAEMDMLANCPTLNSTVLKVGHHGSRTASSKPFLEAVQPEVAVISVGKNGFGHPSGETIERLKNCNAHIYRTDKDGGVTITSDGKRVGVSKSRKY